MSDLQLTIDMPTHDEIRAAVNRMVTSHVFSRSPQLGAFMRFVVEAVLHGKADRIKAYTIGVEVLRRDVKFDPQMDPIVRVEATRLRRAIERYYSGPGAEDPVIIDLPRGSYVPTFRRREIAVAAPAVESPRSLVHLVRGHRLSALLVLIACVLAIALGVMSFSRGRHLSLADLGAGVTLPPGNGMPTIYIEPLRVTGTPGAGNVAPTLLYEKLSDAFARFDTINVVYDPRSPIAAQTGPNGNGAPEPRTDYRLSSAPEPRTDYRLSSALDYRDGQTNALFRLVDVGEGNVVWSRTFERIAPSNLSGEAESRIVVALANALLQSYGVIRARDRAKQLASAIGDPRYRCVLEAADAIRSFDPVTFNSGVGCLERLTVADPSFSVGFAFLALMYNREFAQEYGERQRDPQALDKAVRASQRAIELRPEDLRAYLAMFVVRFARREMQAAFAAGDKCLTLNPYDTLALGEYGGRLILAGQVDKGLQFMQRAGEYRGLRPNWHYFYLFLAYHLQGNQPFAAEYANQIAADNYPLGLVAKAITAAAAGNEGRKRQALDRLLVLAPAWRDGARGELARSIPDSATVDRLATELAALGLTVGR